MEQEVSSMDYSTLNGVTEAIDTLISDCEFLEENFDSKCVNVSGRSTAGVLERVENAKNLLLKAKEAMVKSASSMSSIDRKINSGVMKGDVS